MKHRISVPFSRQLLVVMLLPLPTLAAPLCAPGNATYPLSELNSALIGGAHPPYPSDREIFAPADLQFCPGLRKSTASILDPHLLPDDGSVWRVGTQRWSEDWEKKFSDFVRLEIDPAFMRRYQISTDCADAAITVRTIFARIHHLPVQFPAGKEGTFSEQMKAYGHLKTVKNWDEKNWKRALETDIRFRKFLDEMKVAVGTDNLAQGTYPVKITACGNPARLSAYVRPGTVLLSSDHTRFISKIDSLDKVSPVSQMNSTVPAKVRDLYVGEVDLDELPRDRGFLGYRWPVNCGRGFQLVPDAKMPGYSLEQYRLFKDQPQVNAALRKLAPGTRGKADRSYVDRQLTELKDKFQLRIERVNGANAKLKGDPNYFVKHPDERENFSTPSLDHRIESIHQRLWEATIHDEALMSYAVQRLKHLIVEIGPGKYLEAFDLLNLQEAGHLSDRPESSVEERWGWQGYEVMGRNLQRQRAFEVEARDEEIAGFSWRDWIWYRAGRLQVPSEKNIERIDQELAEMKSHGLELNRRNAREPSSPELGRPRMPTGH